MALLSPGVEVTEKDMSTVVSTAGSSNGVYVGSFKKGEANKAILISNETDLISNFGEPDNDTYKDFLICSHFLMYTDTLYVTRAIDDSYNTKKEIENVAVSYNDDAKKVTFDKTDGLVVGQKYAFGENSTNVYTIESINDVEKTATFLESISDTINSSKVFEASCSTNAFCEIPKSSTDSVTISEPNAKPYANEDDYLGQETSIAFSDTNSKLRFTARTPGLWGNSLYIAIANPTDFEQNKTVKTGVAVNDLFQYAPEGKQFAVMVYLGENLVESFLVSYDPSEVDAFNKSLYVESIINRTSNYVYCKDNTSIVEAPKSMLMENIQTLKFGKDSIVSKGNLSTALTNVYSDPEIIDVDIIMANENIISECISLAAQRADCICYCGIPESDIVGLKPAKIVENSLAFRATLTNTNFATLIDNYIQVYDKYNDMYRWVSPVGYAAGLRASVNNSAGYWFASAGLDNGQLLNITRIAYNPNKTQRDSLYKKDINPICSFPSQGIVLWGQKTLQGKPSAFDRVNVRMLFNYLERTIAKSSKYVVFSQNDDITRNLFVSMVEPVLAQVKTRRGITDYRLICDTSNNTSQVIQNNEFVADIYIKPTYVAEFIKLNFVCVGQSVSFDEVVGG